jgi:hypothetical protein
MRRYHYLGATWALDDIRRRRLKASKIDDMNDPYEWKAVYSLHEVSQSALEKSEAVAIEKYAALCFSRRWNNVLMWSHYGDRHKGICLGFDVADELAVPVEYVDDVLVEENITHGDEATRMRNRAEYEKIIYRSFWAKCSGWCYEKEVRVHGEAKEKDEETGHYFMNFEGRLKLREVIAGARFPMTRKPIDDALKGYSEEVTVVKAGRSLKSFEIIIDANGFDGRVHQ